MLPAVGQWCNGNTWVSKTFVEGSSPSCPARRLSLEAVALQGSSVFLAQVLILPDAAKRFRLFSIHVAVFFTGSPSDTCQITVGLSDCFQRPDEEATEKPSAAETRSGRFSDALWRFLPFPAGTHRAPSVRLHQNDNAHISRRNASGSVS